MHEIRLFLCGDVMTGRGIDQLLRHPSDPMLYESYVRDAREYVRLVERVSGRIPKPVDETYIWGAALAELDRFEPDARIINLETSITTSSRPWPAKDVHYRMHPGNIGCLAAAKIDCCCLANNHVLDWGHEGLRETLASLTGAGIRTAGAGLNTPQAQAPAVLPIPGKGRVLVFALGSDTSGIPRAWSAMHERPGVWLLPDLSLATAERISETVRQVRQPGDIAIVSVHWGGNWDYTVPAEQRAFAHRLIDLGVNVVHGHSSHHVKAIEIHRDRLILYGCGDLLTDYEGIGGHEAFRGDLGLLYLATLDCDSGTLVRLQLVPQRTHRFRLMRPSRVDSRWLSDRLNAESSPFGTRIQRDAEGHLRVIFL